MQQSAAREYGFVNGALPRGYVFADDGAVEYAPETAREARKGRVVRSTKLNAEELQRALDALAVGASA